MSANGSAASPSTLDAALATRAAQAAWAAADGYDSLVQRDLAAIESLVQRADALGAFVRRIPFAYPLYDLHYADHLSVVMDYVHGLENLKTGGRQGLFRYNNMDQSVEMGRRMAAALTGRAADHEVVATGDQYFG